MDSNGKTEGADTDQLWRWRCPSSLT